MRIRQLPDDSVLYIDAQGAMQSHTFGKGVVLHVRRGIMHAEFAKYVMQDGERALAAARRFILMVDAYDAKMHTTEFREVMTDWFAAHPEAYVHMLIRSKLLEMALNVSNLALGASRAKVYYDAELWESIGRQEVPTFERRPLVIPGDVEPG
jgi:hypothetical protein